ncbi:restriction endonuclease subunit S [Listeria monocytogenes serotype 4c]|nr:restriction endonuclease subunit S [Listeria monocytogenes]MCY61456.1 restriction endonuclease subunit S [Listeria monocytogenes serotype 4c]
MGAVAEYYDGTHQTPKYTEYGVPFVSVENINNLKGTNKYISEQNFKSQFKIKPQKNDIFMTRITAGIIGDTAIITDNKPLAYYVSLALIRPNNIIPSYLEKYFNSLHFKNELHKRIIHTAFPKKINLSEIGKCMVSFPLNKYEQEKIGTFFKQLDHTIALHQRKLDALKKMKKGFLQQMFPKSEEDVPKIRFTDFNGNWRQRKLEEVADRVRGNDRRMELPTLTISASKGWLNQHDRFFGNIAGKEQKNYTLLKKGQLSYNHGNSKSAKYGAVFVLRTYDEALVPRIYHSFKTNILANSDFIEYLFATKIPDRELRKIVSSGARMDGLLNINFNDFMSILIMLPFVEEQIKISNSLIRLDKIISLYQNKLDQLIKLKKAYLQYLFI